MKKTKAWSSGSSKGRQQHKCFEKKANKKWIKKICQYRPVFAIGSLTFIIGCAHQTYAFLETYYRYPTSMEVSFEQSPVLTFPAVTMCNANRVKKSLWCKIDKSTCRANTGEKYEDFSKRLYDAYQLLNISMRKMMGHKQKDFILTCYFERKSCLDRITQFFHHDYTNCFTVNGHWGRSNTSYLTASMFQPRSGRPSELSLLLNLEHDEYMKELDNTVSAKMTIHSPSTIPNPEYDGVSLYPGFSYNYGIKEFIVRVLPAPYKTNCKNYSETKEKRTGATQTQEDCFAECTAQLHKKYCNCTVRRLSLIHDIPCCLLTESECLDIFDSQVKDVCYSKCRMACEKTTYNYEAVDHSEYHQGDCFNDWLKETTIEEDRKSYICLRVFYVTADSEIYTHKPMYDGIQVFSIIGGYIGLWLGVSLLDIFGHLVRFTFTCFLEKRSKNRIKNTNAQPIMPDIPKKVNFS